jgi:SHS family lactate transporter-like MFS transporter
MADTYAAGGYTGEKTVGDAQLEQRAVESHSPKKMSAGEYMRTRFSTLKPPMNKAPNPFRLLAMLNRRQWAFFFIGFIAWVCLLANTSISSLTHNAVLGCL